MAAIVFSKAKFLFYEVQMVDDFVCCGWMCEPLHDYTHFGLSQPGWFKRNKISFKCINQKPIDIGLVIN